MLLPWLRGCLPELGRPGDGRALGFAAADGVDGSVLDVLRGIEVRFSDRQVQDPPGFRLELPYSSLGKDGLGKDLKCMDR